MSRPSARAANARRGEQRATQNAKLERIYAHEELKYVNGPLNQAPKGNERPRTLAEERKLHQGDRLEVRAQDFAAACQARFKLGKVRVRRAAAEHATHNGVRFEVISKTSGTELVRQTFATLRLFAIGAVLKFYCDETRPHYDKSLASFLKFGHSSKSRRSSRRDISSSDQGSTSSSSDDESGGSRDADDDLDDPLQAEAAGLSNYVGKVAMVADKSILCPDKEVNRLGVYGSTILDAAEHERYITEHGLSPKSIITTMRIWTQVRLSFMYLLGFYVDKEIEEYVNAYRDRCTYLALHAPSDGGEDARPSHAVDASPDELRELLSEFCNGTNRDYSHYVTDLSAALVYKKLHRQDGQDILAYLEYYTQGDKALRMEFDSMRAQALRATPPVVLGDYPATLFERVERFLRWVHTREWNHFFGADYVHAEHPGDTLEDLREWILKKHAPAANVARLFDSKTDQYRETDESKAAVRQYHDRWIPIASDDPNKVHPFKRASIKRMKGRVWEEPDPDGKPDRRASRGSPSASGKGKSACRFCSKDHSSGNPCKKLQAARLKAKLGAQARMGSKDKPGELCRKFQKGTCRNGAGCRYSHDKSRAISVNAAQSQQLCWNFAEKGSCPFGNTCRFAHAGGASPKPQDRQGARGDKKEACLTFARKGSCHYGDKCIFRHSRLAAPNRSGKPGQRGGAPSAGKPLCRNFARSGTCSYGDKCSFLHEKRNKAGARSCRFCGNDHSGGKLCKRALEADADAPSKATMRRPRFNLAPAGEKLIRQETEGRFRRSPRLPDVWQA